MISTRSPLVVVVLLVVSSCAHAQSTALIEGFITDQHGAFIADAEITASEPAIGITRQAFTDVLGRYLIAALPVGNYRLEVRAQGFTGQVVEQVKIEVGRRSIQDFKLQVGDFLEQVRISSANNVIERSTVSVGQIIDRRMVQGVPLNGRYFLDRKSTRL